MDAITMGSRLEAGVFMTAASARGAIGSINTIVFDIGWVLVHLAPQRLLATLRSGGAQLESLHDVTSRIALIDHESGRLDGEGLVSELQRLAPEPLSREELATAWIDMFEPQAGMLQLLDQLRQSYRVFLLSNVGDLHWQALRQRWALHERVHDVIASFEAGVMKPDTAIYEIAESRCNLVPAETIFIDDLPQNIAAARARGWQGVIHESENTTRQALAALSVI
jgi:HAD superfamily hydrolase (TIGR01509 family)